MQVAERQECTDMQHLERVFQDMIDRGGEGIILRNPKSMYQPGRSPGYLKHKVYTTRGENLPYHLAEHFLEI